MCAPKGVEVSSSEVYGSVSEKCARTKMTFEKRRGGVVTTILGSSRIKEIGLMLPFEGVRRSNSV